MKRFGGSVAFGRLWSACLLVLLAGLGCQVAQQRENVTNADPARSAAKEPRLAGAARDLSQDESAGGHTLRKHVGRSDDQLRERLRHERNIAAASSWSDRETAERAVGIALEQNRDKIDRWLKKTGNHPNLAIDYDGDASHPIGRSLRRDAVQPESCAHATIVLRWTSPSDCYVLTSYPECR
jgi:hypothetical protein